MSLEVILYPVFAVTALFGIIWCFVRLVGAFFSRRLRSEVLGHPIKHALWLIVAVGLIAFAVCYPTRKPPIRYRESTGEIYWSAELIGLAEEITREQGILYYFIPGHHGRGFYFLSEDEIARTREAGLKVATDNLIEHHYARDPKYLVRMGEVLTGYEAESAKSFVTWWRSVREGFQFDAEADDRCRAFHAKELAQRRRARSPWIEAERAKFAKGNYPPKAKR